MVLRSGGALGPASLVGQNSLTAAQAFQAAVVAHGQGRVGDAERLYLAVLNHDSNHFGALHGIGVIRSQQNRSDEAIKFIRKALNQQPSSVEAHNSLGLVLLSLNRSDDAIARFERAIALKPDYAPAHVNLGNAHLGLGSHEEAVACYTRALTVNPNFPEALVNLGTAFRGLHRYDDALEALKRALALNPRLADAEANIGSALLELGRFDEARCAFQAAIEIVPNRPQFYLGLADCYRFAPDDRYLQAMEELVQKADALPDSERVALHFALGKVWADVGDKDRSFRHLLEGNARKRRQVNYDEAATLACLDRIRTIFTEDVVRRLHGAGRATDIPIFVVGMPRSGTTLVEQILASHPDVTGGGERDDLENALAEWVGGPKKTDASNFLERIPYASPEQLQRLAGRYLERLRAGAPAARRITDKMPYNFRFVGLIHLAMPGARVIHVRRNPVDTCLSCFSTLFTGQQLHTYDLAELGRYYRAYDALMQHWSSLLSDRAMLEVHYEDIVADIETQARRILSYCGLDWDPLCLGFHETRRAIQTASAAQVRRPLYQSAVGRWLPYRERLGPLLEALGMTSTA